MLQASQSQANGYTAAMNKQRLAIAGVLLGIIFGLGLLLGVWLPRWGGTNAGPNVYSTATLLRQVKTLSELVTVQYVIEKVVVVEDVKWIAGLGENRVLMIAHGVVKAGMDLGQLEAGDLEVTKDKISIKLPRAQITDAYLDEKQTRVIERTTGLLRAFDKDLEQTARQNAVDDIRRAAFRSGILKDADDRARTQIKHLFEPLGLEVEFRTLP